MRYALHGLELIFKDGYAYKKAGVIVMDFSDEANQQMTLFESRDTRHVSLMAAVDRINKSYGQQKVRLAAQDMGRVWKMNQEKLSPRYTTNINEIIEVKV